jgi:hypothetical protein
VAWRIATDADFIRAQLAAHPRHFFSLRQAARILGVSTQPLRDWIGLGHLKREGPRKQFAKAALERFVSWLEARAEPLPDEYHIKRLLGEEGEHPLEYAVLQHATFLWPTGRQALTPKELAELIGCHPSLIVKAIRDYQWRRLGRRRTPGRWEITRQRWKGVFPSSVISKPRLPPLPRQPSFTTNEVAVLLRQWGQGTVSLVRVREMIRDGELAGVPPPPGRRRWHVTRKSLEKMRRTLLTR